MVPLAWALLLHFRPHDPPPDDRVYPFGLERRVRRLMVLTETGQDGVHRRPQVTGVEPLEDVGPDPHLRVETGGDGRGGPGVPPE